MIFYIKESVIGIWNFVSRYRKW